FAADDGRREIQVVVLEEDERVAAVELLDHRARHLLVDVRVAPPRVVVEVRRDREVPEPVLHEPQRRVRGDVVVEVVCARILREEDRAALVLARDDTILVGHRIRDPRDVVLLEQTAQGGREPAAAAALDALAVLVAPVGDGPAIRDDDEPAARQESILTKRSRDPRMPGRDSISTSSASVLMMAMPSPPSESSSPSNDGASSGSKPAPSSTTSTEMRSPRSS